MIPERHDAPDDDHRGIASMMLVRRGGKLRQRARHRLLRRQRSVVDDGDGRIRGAAVRPQRVEHSRQLLRAGIADDRPVHTREARPVDIRERAVVILATAHQRHGVRGLRMADRDAGICRHGETSRNSRNDFERNPMFRQDACFFRPTIEHEWIAPFEARDHLAGGHVFGDQQADCLGCGLVRIGMPDVDQFGITSGVCEQPCGNARVMNHDVGGAQALDPANGDQARISGASADQVHRRSRHGTITVADLPPWPGCVAPRR
jgi:hypothetical protein